MQELPTSKILVFAVLTTITLVTFLAYFPAMGLGFYLDDWWNLEDVGRLGVLEYIVRSIDPTRTDFWPSYRPLLGVQIALEYFAFGNNPVGYHIVPVVLHLANSFLLVWIVWQIALNGRLAFLSGLFYATAPVYSQAVFLPSAADPLMVLFYFLAIGFWLKYLRKKNSRYYALTIVAVVMGFLSKEATIVLPVILLLIDRLVVGKPCSKADLFRRYVWLGLFSLLYVALQIIVQPRTVNVGGYGLSIGWHNLTNAILYLTALIFPWDAPSEYFVGAWGHGIEIAITDAPIKYVGMLLTGLLFVVLLVRQRNTVLAFLGLAVILNILPIIGFKAKVTTRFLYLPGAVSAILYALLFEWAWQRAKRWGRLVAITLACLLVIYNISGIASAAQAQLGDARWLRTPFRDVSQRHPSFPENTRLYFINSYVELRMLSGMFFLRYGKGISVGGADTGKARLRDYSKALIYHTDPNGRLVEIQVAQDARTDTTPTMPVIFDTGLCLEDFEISAQVLRQDEPLVLLMYWKAMGRVEQDYTVFVHLVDRAGNRVAGLDALLTGTGRKGPTSTWRPGDLAVEGIVLPITEDIPSGESYRLEVGLYYYPTMQRASVLNKDGIPVSDRMIIWPFKIK